MNPGTPGGSAQGGGGVRPAIGSLGGAAAQAAAHAAAHSPSGAPAMVGDAPAVEKLKAAREALIKEIGKVIVGQADVIDSLLIAMFSRGHCLLVGVPGLAKTL